MTRYLIAAVAAALISSEAEAQILVSTGGFYQPAGFYAPFGGVMITSGYYGSGLYSPFSGYYGGGYVRPIYSGYSPGFYNTGYYNAYRRPYGMYRGRGWRW